MIDLRKTEKAACALEEAWAIAYRNAPGSKAWAASVLTWLGDRRVDDSTPLYRSLEAAAEQGETPVAVSTCNEFAVMRWYARVDYVFACDAEHRVFLIREFDFDAMPEVFVGRVAPEGRG